MDLILESLRKITSEKNILKDEPMKNHTTFRTGGIADYLVMPETENEFIQCLKLNVPKTIIGNGSNLIVKDGGIRGLTIKTTRLNKINVDGEYIEAEAGAFIAKVAMLAKDNSLTGLEFASGIPGTVGGAVMMNAGAYGGEMKNIVVETRYIDENYNICKLTDHEFGHRRSFFTGKNYLILSSKLKLESGNKTEIENKMSELKGMRNTKQPVTFPSAGSIFKRPEGYYAGKLIEDCGLKGYTIGGAQVSTLHAGFIINIGGASSKDILDLIAHIKEKVKLNYGVELETEVKIIGND